MAYCSLYSAFLWTHQCPLLVFCLYLMTTKSVDLVATRDDFLCAIEITHIFVVATVLITSYFRSGL